MGQLRALPLGAPPRLPSLREILHRPLFASAEVVAGRDLLDLPVRWVHIGEIPDIATYLHGQELILSTGVGLRQPRDRVRYLERLAACRVAGVSIELGRYLKQVPADMVGLADRLGVPLIVFHTAVRFVDITQDVHSLILQGEQGVLESLHALGEDLRRLGPNAAGIDRIVERLGEWLGRPSVFLPDQGAPVLAGTTPQVALLEAKARELRRTMRPTRTIFPEVPFPDGQVVISRRVASAGTVYGLLTSLGRDAERVVVGMALDLAASAIAQAFQTPDGDGGRLHNRSLVRGLISGTRVPAQLLRAELARFGMRDVLPSQGVVMILRHPEEAPQTASSLDLRNWLARQGLCALVVPEEDEFVAILFDPPDRAALKAITRALAAGIETPSGMMRLEAGVSRRAALSQLAHAYREAEQALTAGLAHGFQTSPLYQELGVLRILLNLRDDFDLEAYIEDELGAVLAHDRLHHTDLLRTTSVLISTNGSKEEASEQLAIHRQTLYYRIRRLEGLLGPDFLSARRRAGLQLAILALQLVEGRTV